MRKKFRQLLPKFLLVLTAVALPLLAGCAGEEEVPITGTSVSVSPSDQSVSVGDTFTVDVVIESDEELISADITLSWDAGEIDCIDITATVGESGDFWPSDGILLPADPDDVIDNGDGIAGPVGVALLTGVATGTGRHATYEFEVKEGGSCTIEVTVESMMNDQSEEIKDSVTITDGTVTAQ